MKKLKILLIEDNEQDVQMVREMLTSSSAVQFEVESAASFSSGIQRIKEGGLDLVMLDLGFADCQGLDTFRTARDSCPGIPIVVLTALADEAISIKAVQEGAQDYLIKGQITGPLLSRSIHYAVERNQLEKRLKQIFKEKTDILETLSVLVFYKDKDNRIINVNNAFAEIMGLAKTDIEGKSCFDLWPEKAEDYWRDDKEVLASKQTKQGIFESFKTKTGEKWLQVDKIPHKDETGRVIGIIGLAVDITERKKAEFQKEIVLESLRKSEMMLQGVIQAVPVGIGIASNRVIEWVNEFFTKITGYPTEEMKGKNSRIIYATQEEFDRVSRDFYKALEEKGFVALETRWKHKDGSCRDIHLQGSAIDPKSIAKGIVFAGMDITERKKSEEAVKKTNDELHLLLKSMLNAFVIFDSVFDEQGNFISYRFVYINEAYEKITGVRNDDVRGKTVHEIWPATEHSWIENYGQVAVTGVSKIFDMYHEPTKKTYHCNVYRPWGSKNRFCVVFEDISLRILQEKEKEENLRRQKGVALLQQRLLAPQPLQEKLKIITDMVVQLFDADFCRIWLIHPGDLCAQGCMHAQAQEGPHVCRFRDRCLHLLSSSGRYTHIDGKIHRRVPFGCYKIGTIASGKEHKFLTNDAQNDPRVHDHQWARQLGLVSFVGYQLCAPGGEALGVMALFSKHPISAEDDVLLDAISSDIALVVQQTIAQDALQKSEAQLKEKLEDLKNFQTVTIDRENMMIELKKEINKLSVELGRPAPYSLSFLSE